MQRILAYYFYRPRLLVNRTRLSKDGKPEQFGWDGLWEPPNILLY